MFYVNQTAHGICRRSFGQSQDFFLFFAVRFSFFAFHLSFFAFRFSLFVFRFSLFDNRPASCFYCLVSEYMSE